MTNKIAMLPAKTWLGYDTTEVINGSDCNYNVYQVSNVIILAYKRDSQVPQQVKDKRVKLYKLWQSTVESSETDGDGGEFDVDFFDTDNDIDNSNSNSNCINKNNNKNNTNNNSSANGNDVTRKCRIHEPRNASRSMSQHATASTTLNVPNERSWIDGFNGNTGRSPLERSRLSRSKSPSPSTFRIIPETVRNIE